MSDQTAEHNAEMDRAWVALHSPDSAESQSYLRANAEALTPERLELLAHWHWNGQQPAAPKDARTASIPTADILKANDGHYAGIVDRFKGIMTSLQPPAKEIVDVAPETFVAPAAPKMAAAAPKPTGIAIPFDKSAPQSQNFYRALMKVMLDAGQTAKRNQEEKPAQLNVLDRLSIEKGR